MGVEGGGFERRSRLAPSETRFKAGPWLARSPTSCRLTVSEGGNRLLLELCARFLTYLAWGGEARWRNSGLEFFELSHSNSLLFQQYRDVVLHGIDDFFVLGH